jgi:hypothetical protein
MAVTAWWFCAGTEHQSGHDELVDCDKRIHNHKWVESSPSSASYHQQVLPAQIPLTGTKVCGHVDFQIENPAH